MIFFASSYLASCVIYPCYLPSSLATHFSFLPPTQSNLLSLPLFRPSSSITLPYSSAFLSHFHFFPPVLLPLLISSYILLLEHPPFRETLLPLLLFLRATPMSFPSLREGCNLYSVAVGRWHSPLPGNGLPLPQVANKDPLL